MRIKRANDRGKRIPAKSDKQITINAMRAIELGHRNVMAYDYEGCNTDPCSWCLFIRSWFKERDITPYEGFINMEERLTTRFTFGHGQPYHRHYVEIEHDPEIDPVKLMDQYHGSCWAASYTDKEWDERIIREGKCLLKVTATKYGNIDYEVMP